MLSYILQPPFLVDLKCLLLHQESESVIKALVSDGSSVQAAKSGDEIEVISKPQHHISIADLYAAKNGERSKVEEIAAVKELSGKYQEWAQSLLS